MEREGGKEKRGRGGKESGGRKGTGRGGGAGREGNGKKKKTTTRSRLTMERGVVLHGELRSGQG